MKGRQLFLLLPLLLCAEPQKVTGFIQNNLKDMTQNGARVVVSSSSSINWCDDIRKDVPSWEGLTGVSPFSDDNLYYRDRILLGESEMIVQVKPEADGITWLYHDFTDDVTEVKSFMPSGLDPSESFLYGLRGDVLGEQFYLALNDAGILAVVDGEPTSLYVPGVDSVLPIDYTFEAELPDDKKVVSVVADGQGLTALSDGILWHFDFMDSTWTADTLPADKYTYTTIEEVADGLFIVAADTLQRRTVVLWSDDKSQTFDGKVSVLREASNGIYYTLLDSTVIQASDTDSGAVIDSINNFAYTIEASTDFGGHYSVWDIDYSVVENDTIFSVATSAGFLYSVNAHEDERDTVPFTYIRRDRTLDVGLDDIYAVPFIIQNQQTAVFEYSLAEDASVSIDIFDYNMDFVCRITDKEPRRSGSTSSSGQSTDRSRDSWDGSRYNRGGETVSPGLYYFRITTDKGEQGFGKIIVAKN